MGIRYGGRAKGTLNKATVQKREIAAEIAARTVADARINNRKLAKQHLSDMLEVFVGMAAVFQPDNPRKVEPGSDKSNPHADREKFLTYMREARQCAIALAPYESPTFRQVTVSSDQAAGFSPDADQPVRYRTVEEIRRQIAERGLPPLKAIIEGVYEEITSDDPVNGAS